MGHPLAGVFTTPSIARAFPSTKLNSLGDELKRETRRPVHEGAILYDVDGMTLDVVANGGKAVRNRIADSFAQNMLGIKGKIHPVTRPAVRSRSAKAANVVRLRRRRWH